MLKNHFTSMKRIGRLCVVLTFIVLLSAGCPAQTTGKITGRVTDAGNGTPLFGANIILEGTGVGGTSSLDGSFVIPVVPPGVYTMKVSYIGYKTVEVRVELKEGGRVEKNVKMEGVAVTTQEVVVTAQASGQNSAINRQLTAENIMNVVSSARIQELPDANAAESVGRLPGVSVVRNGGEATQVVIRGLEPKYNSITIDGVPIPANDAGSFSVINGDYAKRSNNPGGRSVDMSMISSSSLEGIEVSKTVTPDMDAAAIGGTVNFDIRRAKSDPDEKVSFSLLSQGGYNDLMSSYKDYKLAADIEKRFFDDKFGIFVQGISQRQNLTSDQLGAYYYNDNLNVAKYPDTLAMGSTTLTFIPSIQKRYDGTVTLDYKLPDGEVTLLNLISHGTTTTEQHSEQYTVRNAPANKDVITLGTSLATNNLNVVTNILSYTQTFGTFKIDVKLSNAYSDNATPNAWYMDFQQQSAGTSSISSDLTPSQVAHQAESLIDLSKMYWTNNSAWHSFNKQDDKQAALNIEKVINLTDLISLDVKGGGVYKYTTRYYNFDNASGLLNIRAAAQNGARQNVIQQLPWLKDAPYSLDPTGTNFFTIGGFYNSAMDYGKFLKGEYSMYSGIDAGVIDQMMSIMKAYRSAQGGSPDQPVFDADSVGSVANDYSGYEARGAGYLMTTLKIGPWISIIPGVRYQALRTSYTAAHFLNYDDGKINKSYPYTMVTDEEYHGYWLPDLIIKYNPSDEIGIRVSITNTIAYPDFNAFIPKEDIGMANKFVNWNNTGIKPERAHNYDFQVSVYNNTIGLLAVSPFLKEIDNEIYNPGKVYLDTNKIKALGFPSYTNLFTLNTYINNPYRVKVWGIETEWQTHFWYLPNPLNGLVMNINYTHIFSEGKFPYTMLVHPTRFTTAFVDTSFTDRLYQQPNDVVNLSVGYDYAKFSILASMIYQSNVFNQSNFWWTLRSDKAKYLRWDLSVKQGLPVEGLDIYFDVNNTNKEADTYVVRKDGFPNSEFNYGLTADAGIRWRFN